MPVLTMVINMLGYGRKMEMRQMPTLDLKLLDLEIMLLVIGLLRSMSILADMLAAMVAIVNTLLKHMKKAHLCICSLAELIKYY